MKKIIITLLTLSSLATYAQEGGNPPVPTPAADAAKETPMGQEVKETVQARNKERKEKHDELKKKKKATREAKKEHHKAKKELREARKHKKN